MKTTRLVLSIVGLWLAGCAHSPFRDELSCPQRGGPPWLEVTSPHFRLFTDVTEAEARASIAMFERAFAGFAQISDFIFTGGTPGGRLDIVRFERQIDYDIFGVKNSVGTFMSNGLDGQPAILMTGSYSESARQIFQHELMHRFVRYHVHGVPTWLNEGLAEYFSTVKLDERSAVIGGLPYRGVRMLLVPSVKELLASDESAFRSEHGDGFYVGAWALVSLLNDPQHGYRDRFRRLVEALGQGGHADDAFRVAFAGVARDDLEREYRDLLARVTVPAATLWLWRTDIQPALPPAVSVHRLDEPELHVLWAELGHQGADETIARLRAELGAGFDSPAVHYLAARLRMRAPAGWDAAEAELERARAQAPGEPRYQVAQARLHLLRALANTPGRAQRLVALATEMQQAARLARTPSELNAMAWYYASVNDPDSGIPFARRALDGDPGCWQCFDTLARLAFEHGDAGAAADLEERAINLVPEKAEPPPALRSALRHYREAAHAEPAPPGASAP